jgi:hypothetical protein
MSVLWNEAVLCQGRLVVIAHMVTLTEIGMARQRGSSFEASQAAGCNPLPFMTIILTIKNYRFIFI